MPPQETPDAGGQFWLLLCGVTAPCLWTLTLSLCPPNRRPCLPQPCGAPAVKSHWPSRTPSRYAGSPGSEPSQQRENLSGVSGLWLWVSPSAGMGFDFTVIAPLPPSRCGFSVSLDESDVFGGFQRPPVCGWAPAGCGLGALAGGGECTFFYPAD